jgi:hypothetical protein
MDFFTGIQEIRSKKRALKTRGFFAAQVRCETLPRKLAPHGVGD